MKHKPTHHEAAEPTEKASKSLLNLDPSAIAADLHSDVSRHVEIVAVPGAGKTSFVLQLLIELVAVGAQGEQIQVLGFSNATVNTLKDRRETLISTSGLSASSAHQVAHIDIRTMHSYARRFLPKDRAVSLLSRDKARLLLLRGAIRALIKRYKSRRLKADLSDKQRLPRIKFLESLVQPSKLSTLLNLIGVNKASLSSFLESTEPGAKLLTPPQRGLLDLVKDEYAKKQNSANTLDFAEMLSSCTQYLNKQPIERRPKFVIVDEFQDCSRAQVDVLMALAKHGAQIVVVGDPNQSVYGFSGAYYAPLSRFLPNVQSLRMNRSHRLTRQNASLLNALMSHSDDSRINTRSKKLGARPRLMVSRTYIEELICVSTEISRLIEQGTEPNQIMVLARTKLQLNDVERQLLRRSVDTQRLGVDRSTAPVKQILRLVRLFRSHSRKNSQVTQHDIARVWLDTSLEPAEIEQQKHHIRLITRYLAEKPMSIGGTYRLCVKFYLSVLRKRGQDVKLVKTELNRWAAFSDGFKTASKMRKSLSNMRATVLTSTIHRAKGGEWDHVFIVGVTNGLIPIYHIDISHEQEMISEQNLLYVGISRARESLTMFHCPKPQARTRKTYDELSSFLNRPEILNTIDTFE